MRKKNLSGVFALALLATAGYGVNKSMKSNAGLNDLALMNVEALADGENNGPGQYDVSETYSVTYFNGEPYKMTKSVTCYMGGQYACKEGHYYRYKNDFGNWSEWIPA